MCIDLKIPRLGTALVGTVQLVLTAAIIGLEFGSVYIDLAHGTIWIGFWAGIDYFTTSMMVLLLSE